MIVSFDKSFVFVKTKKTAGTSVEIVLSTVCGADDIITPITAADERVRYSFGALPRNYCADPELEARYHKAIKTGGWKNIRKISRDEIKDKRNFWNHMPASLAQTKLSPAFWDSAFKFTVERHPYEKAVSAAYWRGRNKGLESDDAFRAFMDQTIETGRFRNIGLYSQNGNLLVDRVLQYSTLWQELDEVACKLGISIPETQPRAKGQSRKDRRPAEQLLTPEQKRRIYDLCYDEFQLFGYER